MSNLISQLNLLAPEIFVALMAMLILLLDLFVQDKNKHFIYGLSQLHTACRWINNCVTWL